MPQVTSGKEWRKLRAEGVEVQLTSGMVVRVKSIGYAAVLKSGYVPDYLTATVIDAVEGKKFTFPEAETPEQVLQRADFIAALCKLMLVSPRIVDDPQADDEIGMDDLEESDRFCLLAMWGSPTAWLRNFRFGQATDVARLLAQQSSPAVAEPVPSPETGTSTGS